MKEKDFLEVAQHAKSAMNDTDGSLEPKDEMPQSPTSFSSESSDLSRHPTHASTGPTKNEGDLELARTKSIAQTMSPLREFFFVGLLCSAQFVTQAGLLNTLNILHIIGNDLGITDPGVLSWLIAGYSLTVGTFILLSGRCGDLFGYKTMVIIGFGWFAIWNVVAGCSVYASGNGGQVLFIFARVLGGIGPAILLPNALGLLGATYDEGRRKDMVFSLFGACAPSGAVVGGTFAGLWSLLWWPWTFWTFGIALAFLGVLSYFILPAVPLKEEDQGLTFGQRIGELDLLGATVGITAMILFNFAWNQAPGFGWEQPYIYVLLIVGILLFPVFFWVELKVSKHPLIPFDALSTDVSFVMICEMCGWAAFGTSIYTFMLCSPLTNTRHLHLLLHSDSSAAPRHLTASYHGSALPCRNLRIHRSNYHRSCHFSHWPRLGHAHLDVRIHDRQHHRCNYASTSDLLGTIVRHHPNHSLGYGHELPSRYAHHE